MPWPISEEGNHRKSYLTQFKNTGALIETLPGGLSSSSIPNGSDVCFHDISQVYRTWAFEVRTASHPCNARHAVVVPRPSLNGKSPVRGCGAPGCNPGRL